mmetsp:Transcript_10925/g.18258  ORF Transcript_10925/g.18258 Transcript_10925/m.18258 type:complete len:126 (+) Transcript_10925:326-703(+)
MGVTAIPKCQSNEFSLFLSKDFGIEKGITRLACSFLNAISGHVAYIDKVQAQVSPTGFFRDVDNFDKYLENSSYLAMLNNEVKHSQNLLYRERVMALNAFVAIMWDRDNVIFPRESQLFDELSSV